MENKNIAFIYQNAKREINFYKVSAVSKNETYLQGICVFDGKFRTFRLDRIIENIENLLSVEERLDFYRENIPDLVVAKSKVGSPDGELDVCFTGFTKEKKLELEDVAKRNNIQVRASVTKKLFFLCCGKNAGPKKVETSRMQGVTILNESQFLAMLETGEIPE